MAFRNVIIESRCKLEYSMNYLICRKGNDETKILLDEIKLIMVNSTQVSITTCLLAELLEKKIKIIFVDSKHNPAGELVPYQNNYYSYRKIKEQINFDNYNKDYLWKFIIQHKILNQAKNLFYMKLNQQYEMLIQYQNDVDNGDITNREGHSAKVYFNALFGTSFTRDDSQNDINKYLNYGYSILLSSINREIKSCGYLTELGIHHIGESNPFNLSCDFIEPLRPLVDYLVISRQVDEQNYKQKFVEMLTMSVKYNGKDIYLDNAIHLYVEDLLNYLKNGEEERISFIEYEL